MLIDLQTPIHIPDLFHKDHKLYGVDGRSREI